MKMNSYSVEDIIKKFELQSHIEGGHFREDHKSDIVISNPNSENSKRSLLTTCYYLIPKGERSIFHRLTSDEIWNFFCGGPVDLFEIDSQGNLTVAVLGPDIINHELKHLVKRGNWFGVLPREGTEYAFFTAIVTPGFEFDDWEKGDPVALKKLCPKAAEIIDLLT